MNDTWKYQEAWAQWHIVQANDVPELKFQIKLKRGRLERALKDRWPTKNDGNYSRFLEAKKVYDAAVQAEIRGHKNMETGIHLPAPKEAEISVPLALERLKRFVIPPDPKTIERLNAEIAEMEKKLREMQKPPDFRTPEQKKADVDRLQKNQLLNSLEAARISLEILEREDDLRIGRIFVENGEVFAEVETQFWQIKTLRWTNDCWKEMEEVCLA